jgi:CTP:phosphocholine cytidylyltransferase-like protein
MINNKIFNSLNSLALKENNIDKTCLTELITLGLYDGKKITPHGIKLLNKYRIDNAIILAAGMSSRFVPVAFDKPKGLLKVAGEILIERQIRQLKERNINEIIVVVGYKKEQFYYLKDKFNVKLIECNDYLKRNNYASVYAAKKYLKNTIITSSDLYFVHNLFQTYAFDSYYCSVYIDGNTEERGLIVDKDDKIIKTMYNCHDIFVSFGYAFFSKRFSRKYIEIVNKIFENEDFYNKFWADIQDNYLDELYMYIKRCDKNDIYEFDYLQELYDFQEDFNAQDCSETMRYICSVLECKERELSQFKPISMKHPFYCCSFRFKGQLYYFCSYFNEFIDIHLIHQYFINLIVKIVSLENKCAILLIQENEHDTKNK